MMKVTVVLAVLIGMIVKGIDSQFSLPAIRIGGGGGSTMAHRAIAASQSGGGGGGRGGRGGRSFTDSLPTVRISSRGVSFGLGRPNYRYSRNNPIFAASEINPSPPIRPPRPPMRPPFPPMLPFPPMPFGARPRFGPVPFRPFPPMMHPMAASMAMGMPFYNQKRFSFPLTPYNNGMGFPLDDDFLETAAVLGALSKGYRRKRKLAVRKPIFDDVDAYDGEENDALPKPNESKKRKKSEKRTKIDEGEKNDSGFDDEESDD